ncbi:MAG: DedA family protein [Planctomycetes bacterium]|nr:DedA family protein [Planctomycetota bacterium]
MVDSLLQPEHAYIGVFIFLTLTGCGLPIPEEVGIVFAGVQSGLGHLNPWLAFGVCVAGALTGDSLNYFIGRVLGYGWFRRHKWFAKFFHVEREKKMEQLIDNHGLKVFFIARFMVGVRGPMYLAAGILHVPFRKFFLVDLACATIVVGLFFTLSYFFGDQVIRWIREGEWWITVLVLTGIAIAIGVAVWKGKQEFAEMVAEDERREAERIHREAGSDTAEERPSGNGAAEQPRHRQSEPVSDDAGDH